MKRVKKKLNMRKVLILLLVVLILFSIGNSFFQRRNYISGRSYIRDIGKSLSDSSGIIVTIESLDFSERATIDRSGITHSLAKLIGTFENKNDRAATCNVSVQILLDNFSSSFDNNIAIESGQIKPFEFRVEIPDGDSQITTYYECFFEGGKVAQVFIDESE